MRICVLAHGMDDVQQELLWDQRALAAADLLIEDRVTEAGVRAREHLRQAQASIGALGDDEYGQLIKGGPERLTRQLAPEVGGRAPLPREGRQNAYLT
ncbi:hypothetical protein AB0H57_17980 [Micromonospora sp. NPDC050686]|uniref:hypothetical protein n=1 Tax=Micromonospora sp. NPDC050686 TaxID=3154631 RepID=UPI0033C82498